MEKKLQEAEEHLSQARERAEHFKKLLRLERQNARRAKDRLLMSLQGIDRLKEMSKEQSGALADAKRELNTNKAEMRRLTESWKGKVVGAALTAVEWRKQWVETGNQLQASQKLVRALKMRLRRSTEQQINSVLAKQKGSGVCRGGFRVFKKGSYSPEARALARYLVRCGCSQGTIGKVIHKVSELAGSQSNKVMSRRTIGRVLIEGGVASRIQLGYEIKQAKGQLNHERR